MLKTKYFNTAKLTREETVEIMKKYGREHRQPVRWSKYIRLRLEQIRITDISQLPNDWITDLNEFVRLYKLQYPNVVSMYVVGSVASGKAIIPNVTSASDTEWLQGLRRTNRQSDLDVFPVMGDGSLGERFIYQGISVRVEVPSIKVLRAPYLIIFEKTKL